MIAEVLEARQVPSFTSRHVASLLIPGRLGNGLSHAQGKAPHFGVGLEGRVVPALASFAAGSP